MWAGRGEIRYHFIETQLDKSLGKKVTTKCNICRQREITYHAWQNQIKVSEPMQSFIHITYLYININQVNN